MIVEVINTGTELLLGSTVNTHLAYLGEELFPLGLRIARQLTVPDGEEIRLALADGLTRADVIIVTGGLGPTTDDVTREITADLLGLPLVEDEAAWKAIQERFARRRLAMTPRNRRQAQAPKGATVLPNPNGTAPGLYLRHFASAQGVTRHLFLLPGPPRELRPMFQDYVVPILKELAPGVAAMQSRRWLVVGLGESMVESIIGEALLAVPGLELGYCARPGAVEVRCIGAPAALVMRVIDQGPQHPCSPATCSLLTVRSDLRLNELLHSVGVLRRSERSTRNQDKAGGVSVHQDRVIPTDVVPTECLPPNSGV